MFNKEESNKKRKIEIGKIDGKKVGKIILTSTLILMLASTINVKSNNIDCGHEKAEYFRRVFEYKTSRTYDEKIMDFYQNYEIMIDNVAYPIEKFYILFDEDALIPQFHLINIKCEYEDILTRSMEKYDYNKVVRLRDTTAFINMLNSDAIKIDYERKLIIIIDNEKALGIINNWDGMIHEEVPETDAVDNKDMVRRK